MVLPLILSALLASNATGKTIVRSQPGSLVDSGAGGSLASYPFATPGCYATGSAAGTKGETITVSRATTKTCNVGGTLQTCAINAACVESAGLLVEPERTNVLTYSSDYSHGTWLKDAIVQAGGQADPFGGTSARIITATATTNAHNLRKAYTADGNPYALSAYVKAGTRSIAWLSVNGGTWRQCFNLTGAGSVGGYTGGALINPRIEALSGGWYRISGSLTPGSGAQNAQVGMAAADCTPSYADDGSGTLIVFGIDNESGTYSTSYIPTVDSTVLRNADAITITNPWAASNPGNYSVAATFTPEAGRAWSQATLPAVLSGGTDAGADALRLYMDGSANLKWEVSQLVGTVAHGYAAGAAHTLCASGTSGVISLSSDGSSLSLNMSGSGGTVATPPATLRLGAASTAGTEAGGYLQNVKFYKRQGCR